MDEMSMIGRQMLGKVEFKVRDVLGNARGDRGQEVFLGARDTVLAGDPKQCPPIGDEPLYTEGSIAERDRTSLVVATARRATRGPPRSWFTWA